MNKNASDILERLKIQEKALANLADSIKKHEASIADELREMLLELKAIKLFLTRTIPTFKDDYPKIRRKLK